MNLTATMPWIAAAGLLVFALVVSVGEISRRRGAWLLPAGLSMLFLGWSLIAIVNEGLLGFWTEHTRNFWGNQIWFDLLFALGIGWYLIVPRAKAVGMNPLPWLVLVLSTGCIGFLAMTARLVFLEEKSFRKS